MVFSCIIVYLQCAINTVMVKRAQFNSALEEISEVTKAMGHPARITILKYLMSEGPSTCQQIVDHLPYSQSTVSGHLQKLKEGGLISMKSHKTSSIYAFDVKQLQKTHNDIAELFGLIIESKEKKQLSLF